MKAVALLLLLLLVLLLLLAGFVSELRGRELVGFCASWCACV